MYSLREMTIDDKVCEQVSMTMLGEGYPQEVIERWVQQSEPWCTKARRMRLSTALSLVLFVIALGLWSRRNQCQVWNSLIGKLSELHPAQPESSISDSRLSGWRQVLGSQGLQALLQQRCQLLATPASMPNAFFGRSRLMAIDGTLFHTPDTKANARAFGRSSNHYGPGAYPQVKCVLLAECGSHAVVGLEMDRYDVSEVHGAYRLLAQVGRDRLVLVDAGLISDAQSSCLENPGSRDLGTAETGSSPGRWLDVGMVAPAHSGHARYRQQQGLWVRIISYLVTDARLGEPDKVYRLITTVLNPRLTPARTLLELYHERWEIELVIDEIKTHVRAQRKVLRSKTPEGVRQELYGIYLAHYAARVLLAQGAVEAELDPDRLSFIEGLFELTEMLSLALTVEPEEAITPLLKRLRYKRARHVLPARRLRINRQELKQIYHKYKPKKQGVPAPIPFEPEQQFLDFVELLDPLAPVLPMHRP
jgi:hypothetical protein